VLDGVPGVVARICAYSRYDEDVNTSRALIVFGLIVSSLTAGAQPRGVYTILSHPQGFDGAPDLLGVVVDGQFREGEEAAKRVKGGETYRVVSSAGALGSSKGGKPESSGEPCASNYSAPLTPKPRNEGWWIATTAPWNLQPRPVVALDVKNPTYVSVVSEYLEQAGLPNADVQIKRLWRVDLEGDKQDEVIIVARRYTERDDPLFPPVSGQQGDYSVALVRKIVGGRLETIDLGTYGVQDAPDPNSSDPPQLALQYDVPLIVDLNGDGRMELVHWNAYYEGETTSVMEWSGSQFRTMVSAGCGA
jgi:hypothetical protein